LTEITFDTKAMAVDGFEPLPVLDTIYPIIQKLQPELMDSYCGVDVTDIRTISAPMLEGCMFGFSTDKIEKINIGYMVFMKRMTVTPLMIFPRDEYNFPIFSAEIIENPENSHFLLDMHPLKDLVIDQEYRKTYLDPIEPVWKDYLDVHNDVNPNVWYRTFLSPYPIAGLHKPIGAERSNVKRTLEVLSKYLEYYVETLVPQAKPVTDPGDKDFALQKKAAIRNIYRTQDPGAGPLVKVLGVERAKKVIDLLF